MAIRTAFLVCLIWLTLVQPAQSTVLTGGVTASEYLPPVTPELDEQVKEAEKQPFIEWFPVPAWMAGEWAKEGDLTISETDLRTGMTQSLNQWVPNKMTRRFGHRMDKEGNVWWAVLLPVHYDGRGNGQVARFTTIALKCETDNEQTLVARSRYLVSIDKGWGTTQEFQQEALNHYQLAADGELQNKNTDRVFNMQGKPTRDGVLMTKWKRTSKFQNLQELDGIDLEKSLNLYLHTRGLTHLMTKPLVGEMSPQTASATAPGSTNAAAAAPGNVMSGAMPMVQPDQVSNYGQSMSTPVRGEGTTFSAPSYTQGESSGFALGQTAAQVPGYVPTQSMPNRMSGYGAQYIGQQPGYNTAPQNQQYGANGYPPQSYGYQSQALPSVPYSAYRLPGQIHTR